MSEQFTMPRQLAHELLGALFNGPSLNPAGYEALKQDFAARVRAAPATVVGLQAAGELVEIGQLEGEGGQHGLLLARGDGTFITIKGLAMEEVRAIGSTWLYKPMELSLDSAPPGAAAPISPDKTGGA